jgi:hypothetical protein
MLGKISFISMVGSLTYGSVTQSDIAFLISCVSGLITGGYYLWRWLSEARQSGEPRTKSKD